MYHKLHQPHKQKNEPNPNPQLRTSLLFNRIHSRPHNVSYSHTTSCTLATRRWTIRQPPSF